MGFRLAYLLFFCLGSTCSGISAHLREREIGEVNRKLSKEEQISRTWIYLPGKMQKIKAEYYRLYPTGRVDAWRGALFTSACVFFALAFIKSGLFN
jgi:hypothetical protein